MRILDVNMQQIIFQMLKKYIPPIACLDNGAAAVTGKKQHADVGAIRFHILQHLIHVSLKISQMIFLILRPAYNVLKGIDTGDMVQGRYAKILALPLVVFILVIQILVDICQQLCVLQECLSLARQRYALTGYSRSKFRIDSDRLDWEMNSDSAALPIEPALLTARTYSICFNVIVFTSCLRCCRRWRPLATVCPNRHCWNGNCGTSS